MQSNKCAQKFFFGHTIDTHLQYAKQQMSFKIFFYFFWTYSILVIKPCSGYDNKSHSDLELLTFSTIMNDSLKIFDEIIYRQALKFIR